MPNYLILRLDGPMQAWGTHTFEDYRPCNSFPTRSGLLGLLGACLGIDRRDTSALNRLADSVEFTVRVDRTAQRPGVVTVTFEGVLNVIDPDRLVMLLENGIGPAKAFGCGLLLVRRLG